MKKNMKAAILVKPGNMEVRELPVPEPPSGWVRIKVEACSICGSDMHYYKGNYPELEPDSIIEKRVLGKTYGHEATGIVDKPGEGVEGLQIGDRVAVIPPFPCLKCEYCRVGLYEDCKDLAIIGYEYPGGFADFMNVPAGNLFVLPDTISFVEASTLDALTVGVHAVHRAGISVSDRVAVLGAGAIGLALTVVSKKAGAREIFVTAKHPVQRAILKKIGVSQIYNPGEMDVAEKIVRDTGSRGVDCVLESVGIKGDVLEFGVSILRKGGRLVFTGLFEEKVNISFWDILIKDATIIASGAYGMWNLVPEFELAVEILRDGGFPSKDIVTHTFPLEKINEAFQQKLDPDKRGETIKVTILP
jgi:2-desacetyl-2-hydroxyethyl bacteriochlorophyllide A dehydrogenase